MFKQPTVFTQKLSLVRAHLCLGLDGWRQRRPTTKSIIERRYIEMRCVEGVPGEADEETRWHARCLADFVACVMRAREHTDRERGARCNAIDIS